MTRSMGLRVAALFLLSLFAAGCDKCGDRLHFNAPSLPAACGANADPAK